MIDGIINRKAADIHYLTSSEKSFVETAACCVEAGEDHKMLLNGKWKIIVSGKIEIDKL